jgi:Domain of unknown function (DUF4384)
MNTKIILMAALSLSASLMAADTEARRRFFLDAPDPGGMGWAGAKTSIQLQSAGRDSSVVRIREVDEGTQFQPGDRFKLRVQTNVDGYLYLVQRGSTGDIRLLFPAPADDAKALFVRRFETRTIPSGSWFKFDEDTGLERVYMFVSPKPLPQLERLVSSPERRLRDKELLSLLDRSDSHSFLDYYENADGVAVGSSYYVEQMDWDHEYFVRRFRLRNESERRN